MDRKYAAFISYRHLPLDMAVAEQLHKLIERYRVPKDLRRNGQNQLGRVFRDRDELPLSNDLTQDIYDALDRSEYLIVICTPDTPKSQWVRREIQHFISVHGRNKVLTVLAAGTMEESVPEEITTVYGEDGAVVDRIEPLCAFLVDENRDKVLKNLKSEFRRLVAAILGCPYDSLVQRHKRYRAQMLTVAAGAVAAVAVAIIGLLVQWNLDVTAKNEEISVLNTEIQEHLRQTQLNESKALTLLSQSQLAEGDRIGAIESALGALEGDRPYYRPAKTALENALYVNHWPEYRVASQITDISGISPDISEDGHYAVCVTGERLIACYDLYTQSVLWTFPAETEYTIEELDILPDCAAVLYSTAGGTHYLLSLETGAVMCQYQFANRSTMEDYSPATAEMAITDLTRVAFCDLQGNIRWSESIGDGSRAHDCQGTYNHDGSQFLLMCHDDYGNGLELRAALYDTASGKLLQTITLVDWNVQLWERHVVALEDGDYFLYFSYGHTMYFGRISKEGMLTQTGDFFLEDATGYYTPSLRAIQRIEDRICIICNDRVYCVDPATCEVISDTANYHDDEEFRALLEDGSLMYVGEGDTLYRYILNEEGRLEEKDTWEHSLKKLGYFYFTEGNPDALLVMDEDGEKLYAVRKLGGANLEGVTQQLPITLSGNFPYLPNFCGAYCSPSGRHIYVMDCDAAGNYPQYVYRVTDERVIEIPENAQLGRSARFSSDETKLIGEGPVFDLSSGELTALPEGEALQGAETVWASVSRNDQVLGETLLTAAYREGILHWWQDGDNHRQSANPYHSQQQNASLWAGQNGLILLKTADGCIVFDTEEDTWSCLDQYSDAVVSALGRHEKRIAFADPESIFVYDPQTGVRQLTSLKGIYKPEYMLFLKNDEILLALSSTGICSVLDAQSGELINQFGISDSMYGLKHEDYLMIREDLAGEYVYTFSCIGEHYGGIIETEGWTNDGTESMVRNMLGYLPETNQILLTDENDQKLYLQNRLSLEELITMGKDTLAGKG